MAEAARKAVRQEIAAGRTKAEILVSYEVAHGASALATSTASATRVDHLSEYLSDPYEYPPPFLVVPRVALALTNDFLVIRSAWFILQALAVGGLSLAVALWIGGREGLIAGLLLPALWASMPFLVNLEFGQLHFLTLALAMAGMAAIEYRRDVLGGSLLGAAIVMKVAPALLLVYLLARGRWRPVLAVVAWVAVYALLGLAVLGPAPYVAFARYQLPRLASGEAFAFFLGRPLMLVGNLAVYALPLKLRGLGVPGMTLGVSSALMAIYGVLLLPVTVLASRRSSGSRIDQAQRWLAVLNLAALRSPIAPYLYVASGTVWLLTLLAPTAPGGRALAALVAAWLYFSVVLFLSPGPSVLLDLTVAQVAVLALNLWNRAAASFGARERGCWSCTSCGGCRTAVTFRQRAPLRSAATSTAARGSSRCRASTRPNDRFDGGDRRGHGLHLRSHGLVRRRPDRARRVRIEAMRRGPTWPLVRPASPRTARPVTVDKGHLGPYLGDM